MKVLKLCIPAGVLALGFVFCTSSLYGTADFAKKEKKACTVCHQKMVANKDEMTKNLTDTGTCYKNNEHSLEKCAAPAK